MTPTFPTISPTTQKGCCSFSAATPLKNHLFQYILTTTGAVTDYIGNFFTYYRITDCHLRSANSDAVTLFLKNQGLLSGSPFSLTKFIFPIFPFFVKHFVFHSWTVRERNTASRGSILSRSEPLEGQQTTINGLVTEIYTENQSNNKENNPTNNKAFQLPFS